MLRKTSPDFWYSLLSILILISFIAFFPNLSYPRWQDKEKDLQTAFGKERIPLLEFLARQNRYHDPAKSIKYAEEILELSKKYPNTSARISAFASIATVNQNIGNTARGKYYVELALSEAIKTGDEFGKAEAMVCQGLIAWKTGLYSQAIPLATLALHTFQKYNKPEQISECYNNIGVALSFTGDLSGGIENFLKGLESLSSIKNDSTMYPVLLNNIGEAYALMDQQEKALEYYKKAEKIFEETQSQYGLALVYPSIADIYREKNQLKKAETYLIQALEKSREMESLRYISITCESMGFLQEKFGNIPKALEYFLEALKASESTRELIKTAQITAYIGRTYTRLKNFQEARNYLDHGLEIALKIESPLALQTIYQEFSHFYEVTGNLNLAFEYYKKYKDASDKVKSERNNRTIAILQSRFDSQEKQKQITIQEIELKRNANIVKLMFVILFLLVITILLFYSRYRTKTRANIALSREMTLHRETALKLQESEEKFRTLAEKSIVAIYIIQDKVAKYVNPVFYSLYKCNQENYNFIGKSLINFVYDEDKEMVLGNIRKLYEGTSDSVQFCFRGVSSQGDIVHLETFCSSILYENNPAIMGTLFDITERKKAEAELLKRQKLEAVGILADGIAHDFNNLLTIIQGYLSMIRDNVSKDPQTLDMIDIVEQTSFKATDLANRFLTFSQTGWLFPRTIHIPSLVENLKNYHNEEMFLLEIHEFYPADLKPIYADERQVREVLYNLLKNADEATQPPKNISVKTNNVIIDSDNKYNLAPGDYVSIQVIDNGCGIPPQSLEKVFEPYFSTKSNVTQKGMGLGLSLCYSVIKKHNGNISIQSEPGKGTIVEVLLPISQEQ